MRDVVLLTCITIGQESSLRSGREKLCVVDGNRWLCLHVIEVDAENWMLLVRIFMRQARDEAICKVAVMIIIEQATSPITSSCRRMRVAMCSGTPVVNV